MLDMLDMKTKKFLVDNRETIQNEIRGLAVSVAAGAVMSGLKIVFNVHDVERKVIVRDNPDEDFIELEDMSWTNEIRDFIHDKEKRDNYLSSMNKDKKKKKKKDKKNDSVVGGGTISWE